MKKAQAISCLTSWLAGWLVGDATLPGHVDHLRRFHCGSRTGRVPAPHSLPELLILHLAMASVLCRTALPPPSLGILSQLRQSKELIQSTQCSAEVEAPNIWSYRAVLGPRLRCVWGHIPASAIQSYQQPYYVPQGTGNDSHPVGSAVSCELREAVQCPASRYNVTHSIPALRLVGLALMNKDCGSVTCGSCSAGKSLLCWLSDAELPQASSELLSTVLGAAQGRPLSHRPL